MWNLPPCSHSALIQLGSAPNEPGTTDSFLSFTSSDGCRGVRTKVTPHPFSLSISSPHANALITARVPWHQQGQRVNWAALQRSAQAAIIGCLLSTAMMSYSSPVTLKTGTDPRRLQLSLMDYRFTHNKHLLCLSQVYKQIESKYYKCPKRVDDEG